MTVERAAKVPAGAGPVRWSITSLGRQALELEEAATTTPLAEVVSHLGARDAGSQVD